MSLDRDSGPLRPKRKDVGYGRPPLETRFKPNQKPPPRRRKVPEKPSAADLLWKVLQERRRVVIEGKPKWLTNSELLARRAMLEADKGSAVLRRLVSELLFEGAKEPDDEAPQIICEPDYVGPGPHVGIATIHVRPPGSR